MNCTLSAQDFNEVQSLFRKLTGNRLGDTKKELAESRLRKRMIATGLDPSSYLQIVRQDPREQSEFISSLTTHKTDWFREPIHFDFFKKIITEDDQLKIHRPLTIWSAACSTGEEPYSIAISALEAGFNKFRILGTDISEECVQKARNGVFQPQTVDQQVRADLKAKYFLKKKAASPPQTYKINPNITHFFKWRTFNLLSSELPSSIQFDFIFLRNVLIYFDSPEAHRIIERIYHYINPGGYLIIGLSEAIPQSQDIGLEPLGNSIFRK